MIAIELSSSVSQHALHVVSDALPEAVKRVKVIVMYEEADAEVSETKPTLKSLLLSDTARGDLVLPERGLANRREYEAW